MSFKLDITRNNVDNNLFDDSLLIPKRFKIRHNNSLHLSQYSQTSSAACFMKSELSRPSQLVIPPSSHRRSCDDISELASPTKIELKLNHDDLLQMDLVKEEPCKKELSNTDTLCDKDSIDWEEVFEEMPEEEVSEICIVEERIKCKELEMNVNVTPKNETSDCSNGMQASLTNLTGWKLKQNGHKKSGTLVQSSILSFITGGEKSKALSTLDHSRSKLPSPSRTVPKSESIEDSKREKRLKRAADCKNHWKELMLQHQTASSSSSLVSTSSTDSGSTRQCPFYRKIPGTKFVVDAFNYGKIPNTTTYFLSHFHYDHYIGLRKSFNMPIYCSSITGSMVKHKIGVRNEFLNIIHVNTAVEIEGVKVTALDANHCPGSLMFLFTLPNGRHYLHVGDFRATPLMELYPSLWNLNVDALFLDTTYCDPKYKFPSQESTVESVQKLVRNQVARHSKTLILCGSYTIGKEKVFLGIAETLDAKIWADPAKMRILRLLEDPALTARLIDDANRAAVHVGKMTDLTHDKLKKYLNLYNMTFSHIIGVKPSGWQFSGSDVLKPEIRKDTTVIGVPYSEHSSFTELRRFVQFIRPARVIATVNVGNKEYRENMHRLFDKWLSEARQTVKHPGLSS